VIKEEKKIIASDATGFLEAVAPGVVGTYKLLILQFVFNYN